MNDIPWLIREAEQCVKTSRRNRASLEGDNFYASKFLELGVKASLLIDALRKEVKDLSNAKVQSAVEDIAAHLRIFFEPTSNQEKRVAAKRQILALYGTVVEPVRSRGMYVPAGILFPQELVQGTRGYIEAVAAQALGCYELGWYDACAVMIRRLLETLIIECYEHHGIAEKIKDNEGNFLLLRNLVNQFLSEAKWNVSRTVKRSLPKLKDIGDLSAHDRRYLAKKPDLDGVQTDLRTTLQELVHLAGFDVRMK